MHDLEVREVVTVVGWAVRHQRRFDRVERLAHGTVGQRVEVHLEALRVERGDGLLQQLGLDEGDARGSRWGVPSASRYGSSDGGREVLADAVLHDLDAGGGEPSHAAPRRALDELLDLLELPDAIPPERARPRAPSGRRSPAAST